MPVISLLTDFGSTDAYVGIMKAVILSRAPSAQIVDISHRVSPQHLVQAAYLIASAYPYFPKGTVHAVVVDPGVGGSRAILAVKTEDYFFLAPDNGVLTRVLETAVVCACVAVNNRAFFLEPVSRTFHGRDIFAPVAAHLASGGDIGLLGPAFAPDTLVRIGLPRPVWTEAGELIGTIIDIDRFGNLITNIDESRIEPDDSGGMPALTVRIGGVDLSGPAVSYADVPPGRPLAVFGSRGFLEISVNRGNAKDYFSVAVGEQVVVRVRHKLSGQPGIRNAS